MTIWNKEEWAGIVFEGEKRASRCTKEELREYMKNAQLMDDKEEVAVYRYALKVYDAYKAKIKAQEEIQRVWNMERRGARY